MNYCSIIDRYGRKCLLSYMEMSDTFCVFTAQILSFYFPECIIRTLQVKQSDYISHATEIFSIDQTVPCKKYLILIAVVLLFFFLLFFPRI